MLSQRCFFVCLSVALPKHPEMAGATCPEGPVPPLVLQMHMGQAQRVLSIEPLLGKGRSQAMASAAFLSQ